jgi:hypothetical protein
VAGPGGLMNEIMKKHFISGSCKKSFYLKSSLNELKDPEN